MKRKKIGKVMILKVKRKKSETYANLLILCGGVGKRKRCCCAMEEATIFLLIAENYIFAGNN